MLTIYQMEMGLIHNVKRVAGIERLMKNQMKKRLNKSQKWLRLNSSSRVKLPVRLWYIMNN